MTLELSELSFERSFLVSRSIRQASHHICSKLFRICFFGYNNYTEHGLRCYCFLLSPSPLLEICPSCLASNAFLMRLVLLHAIRFPWLSLVASTLFRWRRSFFFKFFFHEPFPSIIDVDDLGEELGWNCIVAQDTPVRCLVRFPATSAPPDQAHIIGHGDFS